MVLWLNIFTLLFPVPSPLFIERISLFFLLTFSATVPPSEINGFPSSSIYPEQHLVQDPQALAGKRCPNIHLSCMKFYSACQSIFSIKDVHNSNLQDMVVAGNVAPSIFCKNPYSCGAWALSWRMLPKKRLQSVLFICNFYWKISFQLKKKKNYTIILQEQ